MIKTKHTCRFGESGIGRTSGGWKFPELTSLRSVSSGNFQPPSVRPIPDSPPCKYVCYKTRKNTSWAVNVYRAWAEYRNTKIETAVDEYSSVTLTFKTTSVKEVDYWLTRFILEPRRGDGKPYPVNSLYNIATGLLRHFKDDLKRFHLNILAKNDANFSSFKDERNNKCCH